MEVQVVRGTCERLALRPGTDCTVTGPLPLLPTVPPLPPPTPTSSTLLLSPPATGSGCSSQPSPIIHNQADKMTSPQTVSKIQQPLSLCRVLVQAGSKDQGSKIYKKFELLWPFSLLLEIIIGLTKNTLIGFLEVAKKRNLLIK